MTAIITGERGNQSLTRYGLEEYVADCVIMLDQRMHDQISTRRLRVMKYRGSAHGTNEYPFLIGSRGISVLPITSLQLDHEASAERILTGIARLDEMLGGKGVFRGSSLLVSGSPGTGKSSIAAKFAETACVRGERALVFAYEESSAQVLLDIGLPDIDGYEVCRRIRASGISKQPVVIAMTGWGQDKDRDLAIAAGFDVHLTKPAEPDRIIGMLHELLVKRN
jgi:circadian clock protein KaiC